MGATALTTASTATPAPSVGELRAQVTQIQAEVALIDDQVATAAEAYNGAVYELGQITTRIDTNRKQLSASNRRLKETQAALAERLRSAYVAPPPSTLQLILSSGSLSSALSGVDAANRVSTRDAGIVRAVATLRRQRIVAGKQLQRDRAAAGRQVATRAAQQATVRNLLARRQAVLSGAKGRLATELAKERARELAQQAELRRQAREIARRNDPATPTAPARPSTATPAGGSSSAGGTAATVSGGGSARNAQAARVALRYLGVPYVWGGATPSGFDCSGLASYAYAAVGVSVPHYTGAIWAKFPKVSGPLQPGDMVFYRGLGHMGIYIGGGNMVHAPRTGDVVKITAMSTRRDLVGAVRP